MHYWKLSRIVCLLKVKEIFFHFDKNRGDSIRVCDAYVKLCCDSRSQNNAISVAKDRIA